MCSVGEVRPLELYQDTARVLGMLEVADGVFEIGILLVHAHLVVVDDGVVLVDTGLPGRSARIEQALREAGKAIGDVRSILLTHWHADHTGDAADLHRRSGARIVATTTGQSLRSASSRHRRVLAVLAHFRAVHEWN